MKITIKDIFYDTLLNYLKDNNISLCIDSNLSLTQINKSSNLEFMLLDSNDLNFKFLKNLQKIEPSIHLLENNLISNLAQFEFNKVKTLQYVLNFIFNNYQDEFIKNFKDIPSFKYEKKYMLNNAFDYFKFLLSKENLFIFITSIKLKVNKSSLKNFFYDLCLYSYSLFSKVELKNIYLNFTIHYNDLIKKDLFYFSKLILNVIDKEYHEEFKPYLKTDKSLSIYSNCEFVSQFIYIDINNFKNVYPLQEMYTNNIHFRLLKILISIFNSKQFKYINDFKTIETNIISKSNIFQIQIFDTEIHPDFIEFFEFGIKKSVEYLLSSDCENNKKYFLLSSKDFKKYLLQSFEYLKLSKDCNSVNNNSISNSLLIKI